MSLVDVKYFWEVYILYLNEILKLESFVIIMHVAFMMINWDYIEFILLVLKVFLTPFEMMQWRQKWFKNSETLKEMVTSYRA